MQVSSPSSANENTILKVLTCRKELESMKSSINNNLKPDEDLPFREKYRHTLKRLLSKEFLKPFLFLNLILNIGLEWAGFPALAFYMHTILKQMEIPLDEYWVAVALAGYRSALTIGLSFVLYKVTSCDTLHHGKLGGPRWTFNLAAKMSSFVGVWGLFVQLDIW